MKPTNVEVNPNLTKLKEIVDNHSVNNYYSRFLKKKLPKKQLISVIIPVMGRLTFLIPVITQLKEAIANSGKKINITIIEHSNKNSYQEPTKKLGIDYHWIQKSEDEPFNKSLCHNVGAILNKNSDYFLFHDLDCLVLNDFFTNLIEMMNVESEYEFIQTFKDRRLLYMSKELTNHIINPFNPIAEKKETFIEGKCCAPGGSILISNKLFNKIGGYDPELFYGYSPEDQFFWNKAELFCEPKSGINDLYHMHHETLEETNVNILKMLNYVNKFDELKEEEKFELIGYKQNILEKYLKL